MQLGGRSACVALFALVFVAGAAACGPDDSIDDETTTPEDSNDDDEFPILQPVALVCPQASQLSLETEALQQAEQNALAG